VGSGVTEPAGKPESAPQEDDSPQTSRDEDLADIVDDLEEKVADERDADPGRPTDRAQTPPTGSADEPPD
jgi:hypothetical protein